MLGGKKRHQKPSGPMAKKHCSSWMCESWNDGVGNAEQCCPLSQHAPCHTETAAMWETFFFLKYFVSLPNKKKNRFQNSLCSPNLQTASVSSFHSYSAEDLMRSRSRVCPDHHFLPQPVTYLSVLIEATRTQSASRSLLSVLHCQSLSENCLQTLFYITVSPLVNDERERREWQNNFYYYACVF